MKSLLQLMFIVSLVLITSCSSSKKTAVPVPDNSTATAGKAADSSRDGSSYEKAIIVKNIAEEYAYIKKNCPDCKVIKQALSNHNKKYYDVLYVNKNGTETAYYFDINSFFGKSF